MTLPCHNKELTSDAPVRFVGICVERPSLSDPVQYHEVNTLTICSATLHARSDNYLADSLYSLLFDFTLSNNRCVYFKKKGGDKEHPLILKMLKFRIDLPLSSIKCCIISVSCSM